MPNIAPLTRLACYVLIGLTIAVSSIFGEASLAHADTPNLPVDAKELARISDADLRKIVADRLAAPAKPKKAFNPADLAFSFQSNLTKLRTRAGEIFGTYGEIPSAFASAYAALSRGREQGLSLIHI